MKKYKLILGGLFLTIGLFWIPLNSYSQDVRLSRQERKEVRKARMMTNFSILDTLITNRRFIVEADFLQNQRGDRISVSSLLNFISINNPRVVLQTSTTSGRGFNGVGGVTAEGDIANWTIVKNVKNMSYNVRFSVLTGIGSYDVSMMIGADGSVRATLTGLSYGKLIYEGNISTIENSRSFKGQNSI